MRVAKPDYKLWAVVPAAGAGKRFGASSPKQYLELRGKTVLAWTLDRLLRLEHVTAVVVALSEQDGYWRELDVSTHKKIRVAPGGSERCHSVLNGLESLAGEAHENDWVAVHDAARPCVRVADMENLVATCVARQSGGILAAPVRDTMKQADADGRVARTLDRAIVWHALTPQCFRYGELKHAYTTAIKDGAIMTDEAAAIERSGGRPLLVEGQPDNIKITTPQDLALAAYYLRQQESEAS